MIEIRDGEPLAARTWWKIGGHADHFCEPTSCDEVGEALIWAEQRGLPVTTLSGGSNVLVSDRGIAGLTMSLRRLQGFSEIKRDGRLHIEALAGTPKAELTKIFLRERLFPAIFLCGIPGDVGGGVVMNAGVGEAIRPREFTEITDFIDVVRTVSGQAQTVRLQHDQLTWSYRHVDGWQPGVIVRVGVSWPLEPSAEVASLVKQATRLRLTKQPLDLPSCGSVFRNPPGQKAGALIEQAGLKGYRRGDAEVSSKHANFIVNRGGALASDVDHVIRHVQSTVKQHFAIELLCEVKYLGRW